MTTAPVAVDAVVDEPVTGGRPTAPDANDIVEDAPDIASIETMEPEPELDAIDVPDTTPVWLIDPDALDTDTLEPDSAISKTTAPDAELALDDEPTRTAFRPSVPVALEALAAEPDIRYTVARVPFAELTLLVPSPLMP